MPMRMPGFIFSIMAGATNGWVLLVEILRRPQPGLRRIQSEPTSGSSNPMR
jgi:hypothetical protein